MLSTYGYITKFAGNYNSGYPTIGAVATSTKLKYPSGIAVDSVGNVYFADTGSNSVLKVSTSTGIITRVAGSGYSTTKYSGDNGPATKANLFGPKGVAVDPSGNMYIADTNNNVIRQVNRNGIITTVAGSVVSGYTGDGSLATSARLNAPSSIALDSYGVMYIADSGNNVIRKVVLGGAIRALAGTGVAGYSGNGGAATSARLNNPSGVAVDSVGNIYIADTGNNVIRRVSIYDHTITTVAGTGVRGSSGNNVLATSAQLYFPAGIAFDSKNNLYIADTQNHKIRKVPRNTGIITTVAGTGSEGLDGAASLLATSARLNNPYGVAIHSSTGNIYFTDSYNYCVRKVTSAPP